MRAYTRHELTIDHDGPSRPHRPYPRRPSRDQGAVWSNLRAAGVSFGSALEDHRQDGDIGGAPPAGRAPRVAVGRGRGHASPGVAPVHDYSANHGQGRQRVQEGKKSFAIWDIGTSFGRWERRRRWEPARRAAARPWRDAPPRRACIEAFARVRIGRGRDAIDPKADLSFGTCAVPARERPGRQCFVDWRPCIDWRSCIHRQRRPARG